MSSASAVALVRMVPCASPPRFGSPSRGHVVGKVVLRGGAITLGALLIVGLFVGPPRQRGCGWGESKGDIASATVKKYAFEAYPSWRAATPGDVCPASLYELNEWMNNKDINDPWGGKYEFECVLDGRGGVQIRVESLGEDGKRGTDDDVRSY